MRADFCDTNVIVYAYDAATPRKQKQAADWLPRLWESREGTVSVQVLQELFVTLTKKARRPASEARAIVDGLLVWRVMAPTGADVLDAIDASVRWQTSFWDAMVLTQARKAQASVVWSEDLNSGQSYDGVVVRNPFA